MHYIFKRPEMVEELALVCNTPRKLLTWMRLHIKYKDGTDKVQSPADSLNSRRASNLEFIWMFSEAVSMQGGECYIATISGDSKSAVAFVGGGKKLKCVVNNRTVLARAKTIEDAVNKIDRNWFRWIEWVSIQGKLVPIKPHYRNDKHEKDTRSYLLRDGMSSM